MIMNLNEGAEDSVGAKYDNPIRSGYHALVRSNSYEGHLKGSERSAAVVYLLSFDSEKKLVAPSLQSIERRWAVAHTGLSAERTEQQKLQEGRHRQAGLEAVVYCRWGKEDVVARWS
ncbi:hypothetical protein BHM03_00021206 [Ensete ventricosum]|nr:hypothetical protein BHM03_00021206 [Ensete ventricosum]